MILNREKLREIVLEELRVLREINPSHKPAGVAGAGRFTKRGAGNIYSLTKNAEEEVGDESELEVPARGKETASGKVGAVKFGANTGKPSTQCGGKTISGAKKSPTRSCTHYPKNYWNKIDEVVSALFLEEGISKEVCDQCIQSFLLRVKRANAALKQAQDPKEPKNEGEVLVDEDTHPTTAANGVKQPKGHYGGSKIQNDKERKTDSRKRAERTKKIRRRTGMIVEPWSQDELSLTRTSSLWESISHSWKSFLNEDEK
jgi:hypothetical protein